MSTLKVTEIQSNSTAFNTPVRFETSGGTENGTLCRAWVNWNGQGTVAIRADFNVNSVSDLSIGRYAINFSNSLTDANYAMGMLCQEDSGGGVRTISGYDTRSASTMQVDTRNSGTQLADMEWNTVSFFR